MDAPLPDGVVTFLASRLGAPSAEGEGSSSIDRATVHAGHRQVVGGIVRDNAGVALDGGDSGSIVLAVFPRATDALLAARAIRDASTADSLMLRVAVHTTETTAVNDAYPGRDIEQLDRLCALVAPGEIIVSGTTAAIVAASGPGDLVLRPLDVPSGSTQSADGPMFRLADTGDTRVDGLPPTNGADLLAERGVTRRERDVFDAVADRLTNAEIAERFCVSERTVESHVSALLRKLQVGNRLELAALASTDASPGGDRELPPMLSMAARRARLVGRVNELSDLMAAWTRAEDGEASLAVVSGEAGIGKTQLVADLAATVHDRGGLVLLGASTDGARVPYQAVVEALELPIGQASQHRLRTDLGRAAPDLARIIPSIANRLDITADDSTMEDRYAIGVGVAGYLGRLADRQPILVVLEDLHWASPPTRDIVLEIGRRVGSTRLMLIATCRDVAPELGPSLNSWLAAVERLPVTTMIRLEGLDLVASRMLLADLGGDLDVDARDAHRRTGGNPLLLRECGSGGGSGTTMQDYVADRRARLADDALLVVDVAAVAGEVFAVDVIAAATGLDPAAVIDALECVADAGLTQPLGQSTNRHVFVHALVRDACYSALGAGRRLQLHASVADALADRADDHTVLPELARHAAIAAPLNGADRAVELAERAGHRALVAGDLSEAAAHFERALDILDLADHAADRRLPLTIRLGESLAIDDKPRSLQILREATRLARRAVEPESFADAVCAMTSWGGSISPGRHDTTFVSLAEEALGLLPDQSLSWRARVQSLLGSHLALSDKRDRGRRLARGAVDVARQSGDTETFVRAVLALRYTLTDLDLNERRTTLEEAEAAAAGAGLTSLAEIAASALGMQAQREGDLATADRWHRRCRELTDANSVGTHEIHISAALLAGDFAEVNRRKDAASAVIPPDLHILYVRSVELIVGILRAEAPPPTQLEPFIELDSFLGSICRALLAFGNVLDGEHDRAAESLAQEGARGWTGTANQISAAGTLALWAEVAAAVGDPIEASSLQSLLDPLAGTLGPLGAVPWTSIDHARSLTRIVGGDPGSAATVLEDAIARSRERGTIVILARELVALAQARIATGAADCDVEPMVSEAREIGRRCDAAIVEHDIGLQLPGLA